MKSISCRFLVAALLAAVGSSAQAKIERTVEKTFNVQPGGVLHVETQGGNISVQPSPDATARVIVKQKIRADTEAEADEVLKKLTLTLEQSGNEISAMAKYERQPAGWLRGSWPPVQVDFVVTVPASFATELHTSGGNIVVGDFSAQVSARTSGGNITLGKIGAAIDASTSGGNVALAEGGAEIKLHTSGGNIAVGRAVGVAELKTSGGNIKIDSVENALRATTSGGDVRAGLVGPLKSDCELQTSGGRVTATVDKSSAFHLDASTSGGNVEADGIAITIEKGGLRKSLLVGDVNGGGPALTLRSSGGDIEVKLR